MGHMSTSAEGRTTLSGGGAPLSQDPGSQEGPGIRQERHVETGTRKHQRVKHASVINKEQKRKRHGVLVAEGSQVGEDEVNLRSFREKQEEEGGCEAT